MSLIKDNPPRFVMVLTAISFSVYCLISFTSHNISMETDSLASFKTATVFGDDCSVATADHIDHKSIQALHQNSSNLKFSPLSMPTRIHGKNRPQVSVGGYQYVKCKVNLLPKKGKIPHWLSLGRVFGSSGIFLNGSLRSLQDDDGRSSIEILPDDLLAEATVDIISIRTSKRFAPSLGPATLVPLIVQYDRKGVFATNEYPYIFFSIESPKFLSGVLLSFLILFSLCWLFGIRYPDISWLIITTSLFLAAQYLRYAPDLVANSLAIRRIIFYFSFATKVSYLGLLMTFYRIKTPKKYIVESIFFTAVTLIVVIGQFATSEFKRMISYGPPLESLVFAIVLLSTSWAGFKQLANVEAKRKRRISILLIVSLVASILSFIQTALFLQYDIAFTNSLTTVLTIIFASYLAVDLVVFHGEFFKEKAIRIEEESHRKLAEEKLKLGSTVQKLLLPKKMTYDVEPYNYELIHFPYQEMSGDWLYVWEDNNKVQRLFYGDVVGKGPQAALAVAGICSTLNSCRSRGLKTEDVIQAINGTLLDLFDGKMFSTMGAVEFQGNSSLRLYSQGTFGWFKASKSGEEPQLLQIRGDQLGQKESILSSFQDLEVKDGDIIFSFTDGILEGSRAVKQFLRQVKKDCTDPTFNIQSLFSLATKFGQDVALPDDRTFVAVGKNLNTSRHSSVPL